MTLNLKNVVNIGPNHTAYDTAQLRKLLSAVVGFSYGERTSSYNRQPRGIKYSGNGMSAKSYKVEYLYGEDSRVAAVGKKIIRIVPPNRLYEMFPLESLALALSLERAVGPVLLSARMMGEIAERLLSECFSDYYWQRRTTMELREVAEWRAAVESELSLQVHPAPVDKKKALPKKSKAERIEHAWRQYGRGKSIDYGFVQSLEKLSQQYNKELVRKRKWGEKLKKLGETPHPYESFPDFLRRIADQAEREKARWGTE